MTLFPFGQPAAALPPVRLSQPSTGRSAKDIALEKARARNGAVASVAPRAAARPAPAPDLYEAAWGSDSTASARRGATPEQDRFPTATAEQLYAAVWGA